MFLAARQGRSQKVPAVVCIKVSSHIDGWLREAYFGDLLDGHPRAIRVFDAFPLFGSGQVLYCLAMEYAAHGDLSAHLERSEKGFSEAAARREIAGILQVLDKLHRGQLLHRDLTPLNVFVCDRRRLKLGDFGIVRQQSDRRGITARTLNPFTAPSDIIAGAVPKWQARDDVYQVGQLLGILIKGTARARIRAGDVRHLACSDHLKEIIYRCIGERRKRYESARRADRGAEHAAGLASIGCASHAEGRASGLYGRPEPRRARSRRARRCEPAPRARPSVGKDDGGRSRPPQSAAGGGARRRAGS